MIVITSIYTVLTLYGLILFLTGFNTLAKEVRQSLPPRDIEMFEEEMTHRQIIGLLLLTIPVFSLMVYLLFYF